MWSEAARLGRRAVDLRVATALTSSPLAAVAPRSACRRHTAPIATGPGGPPPEVVVEPAEAFASSPHQAARSARVHLPAPSRPRTPTPIRIEDRRDRHLPPTRRQGTVPARARLLAVDLRACEIARRRRGQVAAPAAVPGRASSEASRTVGVRGSGVAGGLS